MTSKRIVKWGILGCGKIAHKFAEDLLTIPSAKLFAVASRNVNKARDFAAKYNIPVSYDSYEALCKDLEIDIIYIATPHPLHHQNTMMCLRNNKAVLCEKPFAMNSNQVEEMISLAKKKNIFLMEALWTYFLPHYQYVLDKIKSKELGEVKSLKADFGFASAFNPDSRIFNKDLGGGSLLDVGIYPLFAALTILGYPEEIIAKATFGKTGVDETCTMQLLYKNNVTASLFSAITLKTDTRAIIELENGTITINSRFHEPSSITIEKNGKSDTITFKSNTNGYNFEAIHAQEMLSKNRIESTLMTFEKSRLLIQLLDAVRKEIGLQYS